MARKDDDFFKKLSRQTPLVRRKDLQPLSPRDFSARSDATSDNKPVRGASPKPAFRSSAVRGAELASRYNQRQASASVPPQGLTVFGEEERESVKPQTRPPVKPPQPSRPAGKEPRSVETPAASKAKAHEDKGLQMPVQSQMEVSIQRNDVTASARPAAKPRHRSSLEMPPERGAAPRHEAGGRALQAQDSEKADIEPAGTSGRLSFRHELKYYINYRDYLLLKSTLKPLLSLDRNAGEDGDYHIRSLYFDDVYETSLVEKMAGSDVRSKFRIRIYNISDEVIRFEKKYKQGQYIAKTSLLISRDECEALTAGECGFLEGRREPLAAEIFLQMRNNMLRPRVIVDYRREAYVSPFENVRVTFDKDLKAGHWLTDIFDPNVPTMPVLEPGTMVLEVKFDRYMPVYIKSVLNNVMAAQRSAVSKYVLCRKYE